MKGLKKTPKNGKTQEVIVEHLYESLEIKRTNLKTALNVVRCRKIVRMETAVVSSFIHTNDSHHKLEVSFINAKAAERK